jgi:hypothetical protein
MVNLNRGLQQMEFNQLNGFHLPRWISGGITAKILGYFLAIIF